VLILVASLIATPLYAQQAHVLGPDALQQLLAAHADRDRTERETVMRVVGDPRVVEVAQKLGLTPAGVETAVAALESDDLRTVAAQAEQVEQGLAGGASTVTISTTTVIIGLLVLILILVAVK
jgi:hypothetical protein